MDIQTAIHRYCQYQERCHAEVRNKLWELGCSPGDIEAHISQLIEAGLLNEERFARAYARGKFRIKHWGRVKITQQLRFKKISEYCIKKGLSEIDAEEYEQVLKKIVRKKWDALEKEQAFIRRAKVLKYILQRGFERDLIDDAINQIISTR